MVARRSRNESFRKIAEAMEVSTQTVARAYNYANHAADAAAIAQGKAPERGTYRRLSPQTIVAIERMLRDGISSANIAREVGCGLSTVNRERRRLGIGSRTRRKAA